MCVVFSTHRSVIKQTMNEYDDDSGDIIIIIIIIKQVLIKVTLSCQRHCRGTAQSLSSKKNIGRRADSRWPQAGNSCSI